MKLQGNIQFFINLEKYFFEWYSQKRNHNLVDICNKDAVLYEVKEMLTNKQEDWWDTDFTKEEQDEILEDSKQIDASNYYTQEQVHKVLEQ